MPPAAPSTGDSGPLITSSPSVPMLVTNYNTTTNSVATKTGLLTSYDGQTDVELADKQYGKHHQHLRQPEMMIGAGQLGGIGKATSKHDLTPPDQNAKTSRAKSAATQNQNREHQQQQQPETRMGSMGSRQVDPAHSPARPTSTLRSLASSTNLESYQRDLPNTAVAATAAATEQAAKRLGESPREPIYIMPLIEPPIYYISDDEDYDVYDSDDVELLFDTDEDTDDTDDDDNNNGNCSDDYINYTRLRFEPEHDFDLEDLQERLHLDALDMPFRLLFDQDQVSVSSAPPEYLGASPHRQGRATKTLVQAAAGGRQRFHQQQHQLQNHLLGQQHCITLEELRSSRNSCWLCGCNWLQDHVSLDCQECGGYALSRPCPNCDGKCKQTWKRNISATHDKHRALWVGECHLASEASLETAASQAVSPPTPIEHLI